MRALVLGLVPDYFIVLGGGEGGLSGLGGQGGLGGLGGQG